MDEFEMQLKRTFLEEAEQLLSDCEQSFMDLEKDSSDKSVLEKIFRLAHSFKGSAGAAGFNDLMHLAHQLESLLVKLTGGELQPSIAIVSLLLRANDQLALMVRELNENIERRFDINDWVAEIQSVQDVKMSLSKTISDASGVAKMAPLEDSLPLSRGNASAFAKQALDKINDKPTAAAEESIRVNIRRIDKLVNDVGELVILQAFLYQHRMSIESPFIQKTITHLEKITRQIQDTSMGLRMVPMKPTFQKLQRIIRDSAQELGKQISFETSGEDAEIDKTVLDVLSDPLVHMIRNAVDHGIETIEEREAVGKNPQGLVKLTIYNRGDNMVLEIKDDGKGLNIERILAKAKAIGLVAADAELSEQESYKLIFASGFSTKDAVTALSGRGVGMDVVKTQVEQVKGSIEVQSKEGQGSTFRIVLPLTLALIDGLIVLSGGQRYVLPIHSVVESLQPKQENLNYVSGKGHYLNLRGETLPIFRLSEISRSSSKAPELTQCIAVVAKTSEDRSFALIVEEIVGQQQIVIKSLGPELQGVVGVTGAAILGDGRPALILDMPDLVQWFLKSSSSGRRAAI